MHVHIYNIYIYLYIYIYNISITYKISAPTWNEKLELPDESYSISDI